MATDHRLAAAAQRSGVAGGVAEISFLAAGPAGESWFHRSRIPAHLCARVPAPTVGPSDRRRGGGAATVVLAARPAHAAIAGATLCPARARWPAGRARLGDGRVGPGRPAIRQPLPSRR